MCIQVCELCIRARAIDLTQFGRAVNHEKTADGRQGEDIQSPPQGQLSRRGLVTLRGLSNLALQLMLHYVKSRSLGTMHTRVGKNCNCL